MGRLTSLVKETAIYGISSILGRMLNWLLVPLYTQYLVPADYGIVTELYAYAAFLLIIYTYGMETAFFRFSTKSGGQKLKILNLSQSSVLISSLAFSVILIVFATPITNYLEYPGKEKYIFWFSIILAIDAIVAIPFANLRLQQKAKKFAGIKLINIFLNIGFNLFFILFCTYIVNQSEETELKDLISVVFKEKDLVDYIFISNLIASSALLIIFFRDIIRIRVNFEKALISEMYKYAFPIMIMSLAGVTNEMLSRAVLKKWLPTDFYPEYSNQAALGIFGAAYKLSIFMTLSIQAFRYAAEPFFFSRARDKDSRELFGSVMNWFIIFGSLLLIVIVLNLDIIGYLFLRNEAYWGGLVVVPILLLANFFLGIYYNLSIWFKLTDKTYYGTLISIAGAIITIALNFLLIPLMGYLGSSIATLVCYLSMVIISYNLGKRHYPIPYKTGKYSFYILISAIIAYLGFNKPSDYSLTGKFIQFGLILIFIFIILMFERRQLLLMLKSRKNENKNREQIK
jgi:O-antigen/teichoic acid export membrane protein